eukprot:2925419-Rhodomonas_salina.2
MGLQSGSRGGTDLPVELLDLGITCDLLLLGGELLLRLPPDSPHRHFPLLSHPLLSRTTATHRLCCSALDALNNGSEREEGGAVP